VTSAMYKLLLTVLFVVFVVAAEAQTPPLVIAFAAPNDHLTQCPPGGSNPLCYDNFVNYELQYVSGIGIRVPWGKVDDCYATGPCDQLEPMPDDGCSSQPNNQYNFCYPDQILERYIGSGLFANKKIVLIVSAINDSSPNSSPFTPDYVFSTNWAGTLSSAPQDVVVCSSWQGSVALSGTCPVTGTVNSGSYAVWNANGGSGPIFPNGNCTASAGGSLHCTITSCTATSLGGFPIIYEKPFMVAYQDFLRALAQHYNTSTGNSDGQLIAPYIAYVRAGMAEGGENQPFCATTGGISQPAWSNPTLPDPVPAGYIVNTGGAQGTQYVAVGAGHKGSTAMPACSPAGCTTAPDGHIPGWLNAGQYSQSVTTTPIWPGPEGLFAQATKYTDNGYLTAWPTPDGTGYIAAMVTFMKSLGASFPFDISAHNGPPSGVGGALNVGYADSEAIIASTNGVGFGMQSVSINDGQQLAKGTYPTSPTDWVYNFKAHPAPVHHLQMYQPGGPSVGSTGNPSANYFAAGYPIDHITVSGTTATIYCPASPTPVDCSPFSGEPIFVTGNSNPALNGLHLVTCSACPVNTLTFSTSVAPNTYPGGTVWSPNYWPIVMPFAVQHKATTIEVYECDLDYAYGAYPNSRTTTAWVTDETGMAGGCAAWGLQGQDPGYQNSASDTEIDQPWAVSVRTGKSILINGTQF